MPKKNVLQKILEDMPKETLVYDDLSFAISSQAHKRMESSGVTVADLASKMGCSERKLRTFLAGDEKDLSLRWLAKLISLLDPEGNTWISFALLEKQVNRARPLHPERTFTGRAK